MVITSQSTDEGQGGKSPQGEVGALTPQDHETLAGADAAQTHFPLPVPAELKELVLRVQPDRVTSGVPALTTPGDQDFFGIRPLLSSAPELVKQLKLSEPIEAGLVNDFKAIAESFYPEAGETTPAQRVFAKLLLKATEVQALKLHYDAEVALTTHGEFHRAKIALAGAIYMLSKIVDSDPTLAAEILRGYDSGGANWKDIKSKLEDFYRRSCSDTESPLAELIVREVGDETTMGETAFLAGMLTPYLAAFERTNNWWWPRFVEFCNAILENPVPEHLKDLGIVTKITYTPATFIEELSEIVKPPPARKSRKVSDEFLNADEMLRKLLSGFLEQADSNTQHVRSVFMEALKWVKGMSACSEDDLALAVMQASRYRAHANVKVPVAQLSVDERVRKLPANERQSNSDYDPRECSVMFAVVTEVALKVTAGKIVDAEKYEKVLNKLAALFEDSWGLDWGYLRDIQQLLTAHHTRVMAQALGLGAVSGVEKNAGAESERPAPKGRKRKV